MENKSKVIWPLSKLHEWDERYCDVIRKRYENFVQNKEKQV